MGTTSVQPVNIIEKKSLIETLKSLTVNEPRLFSNKDFKIQPARQTISNLRKNGYEFIITEEGLVDSYIVTCTKKPEKDEQENKL